MHRLDARRGAQRAHEAARIADALDVEQDVLGLRRRRRGSRGSRRNRCRPSPPSETTLEKPTLLGCAQSSIAVHIAPDCETRPMVPGSGAAMREGRVQPVAGRMMPRQFGPMSRRRWRRAFSSIARSSAAPAGPVSAKPPEMTMAVRVPARAAGFDDGRHGFRFGADHREVEALRDALDRGMAWLAEDRFVPGLTRKSLPGKCMSSMLRTSVAPIEPVRSEAPMTATDFGSNKGVR